VSRVEWIEKRKEMTIKIIFLTLFALLAVLSFRTEAQQPKKVLRIGYLSVLDPAGESSRAEAIRLALHELGYIEGHNIAIEYRYAKGKRDRFPELAAELVRLKVDIIVAAGGATSIRAAKNATKTIPIVMMGGGLDPVEAGVVESLPVPAATSPASLSFPENWAVSAWNCSKQRFPNLPVLRFSTIRPIRPLYAR